MATWQGWAAWWLLTGLAWLWLYVDHKYGKDDDDEAS